MASKVPIVTPLWYQIYQRQLSYKEFLDRFNDKQFQERDVIPIFLLSAIHGHDQYVNGMHILHELMGEKGITERALKYFYIYWSIGKGFSDDLIIAGNPIGGTFRKINIRLHNSFTAEYLYDWMGIIVRAFFNIPVFVPNDGVYERGDFRALMMSLKYAEKAKEDQFEIQDKTAEKLYKLSLAHTALTELIQFFQIGTFPQILKPYRKDKIFFRSVVGCFSPLLLKGMNAEMLFSDEEVKIIHEEHRHLYEAGDIEFFIYYLETFVKTFDRDHPLVIELQKYLEPSKESDRLRTEQYLKKCNSIVRRNFIPQYFPISEVQLHKFIQDIQENGVINALKPYILNNKRFIQQQLELSGCELANDTILTTQCSIYLYPIDKLIFYADGKTIYVFLPEELSKFINKENPYNRQILPDYLFTVSFHNHISENFEEIWSKILRYKIDLQSILNDE
jgi:hypothetical protein